jgi:hypothetical protein
MTLRQNFRALGIKNQILESIPNIIIEGLFRESAKTAKALGSTSIISNLCCEDLAEARLNQAMSWPESPEPSFLFCLV